jgi:hypothetical protein
MTTIKELFPDLPTVVLRCKAGELTNGLVSPRTLANHDSAGTGPKERFMINGKVAYSRDSFLAWLSERSSIVSLVNNKSRADAFLAVEGGVQ